MMETQNKLMFSEVLENMISERLVGIFQIGSTLTRANCLEIFYVIFNAVTDIVNNSGIRLSNDAVNYVATVFYDNVKINNQHSLDPSIFTKRVQVNELDTKELVVLAAMLRGTQALVEIVKEVKRRG